MLKIDFLILFGCGVKITPEHLSRQTKTETDRQRQTEIINREQRELSLKTKLVISFNWGKINAITPD